MLFLNESNEYFLNSHSSRATCEHVASPLQLLIHPRNTHMRYRENMHGGIHICHNISSSDSLYVCLFLAFS